MTQEERLHEARNAAYDLYDSEYHDNPHYEAEVSAFLDGVKWADEHQKES